ncbi:hypothetical protein SeMB42_g01715 [Synchytrium endobioticum]|uniref:Uncharacterized protein n=1 Tax=Synchytrium endobioticum TaxID=286115 RepID=A0A507DM83_9FUNG|nr:hypothetical protein SeMB42_g01715 [Synchytrium endobioticum]
MMKHYLSLEVNYGIELGIVAQHIQPLFTTQEETGHGNEWDAAIDELRAERGRVAKVIDAMNANGKFVSLEDATDLSVMSLNLRNDPPLSPQELAMAPTSHMSVARLHYVKEYNALLLEKFRFKSVQLTKVLDHLPRNTPYRQDLESQLQQTNVIMGTYLRTACSSMDVYSVGNEVNNPEETVPVAFPESVEPEGELDFDFNFNQEEWNMVLQLLREPDGQSSDPSPSYQEYPSLVDNQASTGMVHVEPYRPIRQELDSNKDVVYDLSPGIEGYGREVNHHHVDLGVFHRSEAEDTRGASVHRHMAHADEAGSSRKQLFCTDDQPPGQRNAGITPVNKHHSNERQYRLDSHR